MSNKKCVNNIIINGGKIEFNIYDSNLLLLNKFGILTLSEYINKKQLVFVVSKHVYLQYIQLLHYSIAFKLNKNILYWIYSNYFIK